MAVETRGTMQLRAEEGPATSVDVVAADGRLRVSSKGSVIGDWAVESIGIHALNDGFAIRVEGEELILKTDDDPAVAEEIGLVAVSPRLARRVAASHKPEDRPLDDRSTEEPGSSYDAIIFALGGALAVAGGLFLRQDLGAGSTVSTLGQGLRAAGSFWFAFVVGGLFMIGIGYALARHTRWGRWAAILAVAALILFFALAASDAEPDADHLLAYGFIAGGIVVGVAVVVGKGLNESD